jgi:protein-tyrosine phosphatase
MESVYRVCFVCTGNICRSPAAEVVVRALIERADLPGVEVDSCGVGDWHTGAPADPRALRALTASGYEGRPHRARAFEAAWFRERDLLIALDRSHARMLRSWATNDDARAKIRLLRSFDPGVEADEKDPLIDVKDPYYEPDSAFTTMVAQIEAAGAGLLEYLRFQAASR